MSLSHLVENETEVRRHILEPFLGLDDAGDCAASDAERLLAEAYEQGLAEGRRAAGQELRSAVEAFAAGAGELAASRLAAQKQMEHDVVALSVAIARRIVMHELATRPEVIGEIVRRLTEEAEDRKVSTVRLHPADVERVRASQSAASLEQAGIVLQPSEEIREGGCVLETGFGRLDARIETRLEEITSALLGTDKAPEETVAR